MKYAVLLVGVVLVLGGCADTSGYDPTTNTTNAIDKTKFSPIEPIPDPTITPAAPTLCPTCHAEACRCTTCVCSTDGACLDPQPVKTVAMPQAMRDVLDTSRAPQACRRNADGSWTCPNQPASGSRLSGCASGACGPQRVGPVRGFVRRVFGR